MREIKFRAWDKIQNKMYYESCAIHYIFLNDPDHEKADIMQFTGLHDNTSKEIYEGDIWVFRCLVLENGKDVHKTACAVIEWQSGGMGFHLKVISDCWFYNNITDGEIIGNIYENPERLTRGCA